MALQRTSKVGALRSVARFIPIIAILLATVAFSQIPAAGQWRAASARSTHRNATVWASDRSLFLPAVPYDSGGVYPTSVAVADVNGDGKPDLLVSNSESNTLGVLLGNGDGTFQPVLSYSTGGYPQLPYSYDSSVAVGDLNGDGRMDVVVTNTCVASNDCSSGSVAVLLGNGDGTFQPVVTYDSGGGHPNSIALADVNGDGKLDLIVNNRCAPSDCFGGSVAVLLGNGDGSFQKAVVYNSGGWGPMQLMQLGVADVNGDGTPDILVATQSCVGVLLGNGDGTFRPAACYPSPNAQGITIADLNGDGRPDIVTVNGVQGAPCAHDSFVGVMLGNGDGTFQSPVNYDSGGCVYVSDSVAVIDVNGDGKPDIIIQNYCLTGNPGCGPNDAPIGVLLGNGDGTFQPVQTVDSGEEITASLAVADLNGDGKPDLIVAYSWYRSQVGVLLNNSGAKAPTATTLSSSLNPSLYGQKATFTAKVTTAGALPPSGRVAFTWQDFTETYTIGSATVNSSGVATLTKFNLNADPYPLTAVYKGDVNNLSSTSPVLNLVVLETTSAAAITASPNPSTVGQVVTFSAKITSPTVTATGPVTFTAGKTVLGTAQLSGGKATFTTSSLPAGSTVVTVTYNGDSNIAKSTASVTQVVNP